VDLLDLDAQLSEGERAWRDRVRVFADAELRPHVDGWFERGEFPRHLPRTLGQLGVLGMHLEGHGCAGAVEYGVACMELEACDMGFANGPHRCLGMHLARRELQLAVEEWLRVIPDFRIATDEELSERGGGAMMTLTRLPLVWDVKA
jgi:alkylation response protein AidB-like acyl-CoA dehydrogenase